MIETSVLFAFIAASAALIAIPGPNVAVIMATGTAHGVRAAMSVVIGTTLAQAVQIALVVLGLTALLSLFSWAFLAVKWLGIAYLVWLGVSALRAGPRAGEAKPANGQLFLRGAATALANPKTMVFHAAFLPLFVSPSLPAGPQLFILAASFLVVALVLDTAYALAGGALAKVFSSARFKDRANRLSGVVMLVAAGWLALRREA
jgi:homoserine/homoserine lactone efflux protein